MGFQETLSEIQSWPHEEQLRLVETLVDSFADQQDQPELSDELKAELDRRFADLEANPELAIPWESVEAEFQKRFGEDS
jgi:putative addiction module component (TIGR02574 family)